MTWVDVPGAGEIEPGHVAVFEAGGNRLAVCNVGGALYAVDDICSHDGGPLDQGELIGDQIECPRHGARFDVKTGRALTLPAVRPIGSYAVRTTRGVVQVQVE